MRNSETKKDGGTDRGKEEEDEGGEEGERRGGSKTTDDNSGRQREGDDGMRRRSLTDTHRSHSGRFDIGRRTSQPTCSAAIHGRDGGSGGARVSITVIMGAPPGR